MSYIDKIYYDEEYQGIELELDTFYRLSKRASETIDILTNYQIKQMSIDAFSEFTQEQIKLATATQIEYIYTNGEGNTSGSGGFGQVTAGNFSYGDKPGKESISRAEMMTSQKVTSILSFTGLLYQGVDVYG